jgi:GTPase involved in cell partitioning and DNA repair
MARKPGTESIPAGARKSNSKEEINKINDKIADLKKRVTNQSSTLVKRNIDRKIKKLEEKKKKIKPSAAEYKSPFKSNVFRQTQKKNPMLRSVDTKTFKGKSKSKRKALDPRRFDSRSVGFKRRKI